MAMNEEMKLKTFGHLDKGTYLSCLRLACYSPDIICWSGKKSINVDDHRFLAINNSNVCSDIHLGGTLRIAAISQFTSSLHVEKVINKALKGFIWISVNGKW